mmetsp:Transcript_88966/g.157519  ORF Transcript_88966/g.157519 Transcript_88966/m.157519 type:complete len:158 (+) Transcript_88966:64-537(+)|eukprot:CAMPEP_0197648208 /NCGR_PEP_ID=MMETSP1338-20131121/27621_1 /TAXON_ID=43686 ORGANISM="Pelagodinium beii, Strain RCC1491" /NCGR_SAMPLE_ID=MMETSP1338 /ASSEMBLY_ACC=CAM_ASM_000754 /LENGTH=157 /DNA_ID=CAMNT_0043222171 /DNA_START=63 /DNA_END=536 /DNA_ORIENTATION=-
MAPAIPKVAIPPEKWTQAVYATPESCLAKAEAEKLPAMQFDPNFFSRAYVQCLGRGQSHKECLAALPAADERLSPTGPLTGQAASPEVTSAIACIRENGGDADKCSTHFEALSKLAGYKEEVKKSSTEKASDFCSKAGWNLLALPVLYVGMKFIKMK